VLLLAGGVSAHAQDAQVSELETKTLNLTAYAELLRSDVRAQKVAIITEVMGFTEAEDAAFWPIYREYEAEMAKLGDERVALIAEYAKNFATLTDAVADKLATKAIELESKRQAAKGRCYERVKAALSPRTAMRFLQVEHQLQLLVDLQIAASLPVAPTEAKAGKSKQ
jgi:outer membrane murein-binding lipoprotein Lpp